MSRFTKGQRVKLSAHAQALGIEVEHPAREGIVTGLSWRHLNMVGVRWDGLRDSRMYAKDFLEVAAARPEEPAP